MSSPIILLQKFKQKYEENGYPEKLLEIRSIVDECTSDQQERAALLNEVSDYLTTNATIPDLGRVIILIHGIGTRALWQEKLKNKLEDSGHSVYPLGYGYFDILRFVFPWFFRGIVVKNIAQEIRTIQADPDSAGKELVIISHSFGTYISSKLLENYTDIKISRIILSGSIVREGFRWDKIRTLNAGQIINDYGLRDMWPVFAKVVTWGYGSTGTFGFKKALVKDRVHNFKHSDYFDSQFIDRYWLPYVNEGIINKSTIFDDKVEDVELTHSRWLEWLGILPMGTLAYLILIFLWYSY